MSEAQWQAQITELRHGRHMRYDDTTLVLLRVLAEHAGARAGGGPAGPLGELNIEEWSKKVKAVSEQITEQISEQIDQVSGQVLRGMKKLKDRP